MVRVAFAPGSGLLREADRPSELPMVGNGPPGTFVLLPGLRVSLPTDQIVDIDERGAGISVTLGGFRFDGVRDGRLAFSRVRDLRPEHELSPVAVGRCCSILRGWLRSSRTAFVSSCTRPANARRDVEIAVG